jgi:hypothetical protein
MTTRWIAVLATVLTLSGCKKDDGEIDILECEGECSCDPDTRTCWCHGGTECVVEGESDITLVCEGNADCDISCEERCHVECPGGSHCVVELGNDSTAICNGTGSCDILCHGDCSVDCPGAEQCIVRCGADYTCTMTSCEGGLTDCGDGVQACRWTCP